MLLIDNNLVLIDYSITEDILDGEVLSADIAVFRGIKAGPYYIQKLDITILIDEEVIGTSAKIKQHFPIINK
jgi:hypothetical protein